MVLDKNNRKAFCFVPYDIKNISWNLRIIEKNVDTKFTCVAETVTLGEVIVGTAEGTGVGDRDGVAVGIGVGTYDGVAVGIKVGIEGAIVGTAVGDVDGVIVGINVGLFVGTKVGATVGAIVGAAVCPYPVAATARKIDNLQ